MDVHASNKSWAPPLAPALIARRKKEAQAKQADELKRLQTSKTKPRCPFEMKRKGHECRDLKCWESNLYVHAAAMGKVCKSTCFNFHCDGVHDRAARQKNVATYKAERAAKRRVWENQKGMHHLEKNEARENAIRASKCNYGKRCCKPTCIRQHPEGYLGPCPDQHHCTTQPALWSQDSRIAKCLKAHPPYEITGFCPKCNQLATIPNTREPLGCSH